MYQRNDKSRIWKLTGAFFGTMVLFTLLSRAIYQHGTAVVTVEPSGSGVITHSVRTTGKAVQNQDLAVTTVGGLRVGAVMVNEGQQVAAGDLLFTLDLDYLTEAIQKQKWEMEKQRLSIQDAWSQNYAASQQRSNQQAQAEENYTAAVSQAETALERAKKKLERAKQALENFYNGVTQEETLTQALDQAKAEHQAAQNALAQLQTEIENKVREAVEQAKQEASQPTETEPLPTEAQPLPTETEPASPQTDPAEPTAESRPAPSSPELPEDAWDPSQAQDGGATAGSCSFLAFSETISSPSQVQNGRGTWIRLALLSAVTSPDLDAVEAAVRAAYAQQLSDAQAAVERTRAAMEDAQAELERCQSGAGLSEQDLLANVETAQERYHDALAALKNAKTTYGRAIQSASLPESSNHAAQIGQLSYDQMAADLDKLEALQAASGEIRAPVDGVVTSCRVQTGEKTTDTTSILLADLSRGCKFSGSITEEQSKYIGVGDLVTLQASSGSKQYKDLPVTLLTPDGEDTYQLTVQLPENTLALGAGAELTYSRRSRPYNCCVKLSALHLDAKNQPYVLVAEEVKTVLGTQNQARKVPVTVLEQNDTTAALADGSLGQGQQVIVSADRPIDAGSRVRVG